MNRLLWREFLEYFFIDKRGKKQTMVMDILIVTLYFWMLYMLCSDGSYDVIVLVTIGLTSHFLNDKNIPDVMYMLPGTIENYLYARLKFIIRLQWILLAIVEFGVWVYISGR